MADGDVGSSYTELSDPVPFQKVGSGRIQVGRTNQGRGGRGGDAQNSVRARHRVRGEYYKPLVSPLDIRCLITLSTSKPGSPTTRRRRRPRKSVLNPQAPCDTILYGIHAALRLRRFGFKLEGLRNLV